ncbi:MAG: RnfH family protein, partial [Candidatus Thiodiazotropha sp.]
MIFEVAFGRLEEQAILSIESAQPLTAEQAIKTSGILQMFPEIDLKANKIGIFGKAAKLDMV